MMKNTVDPMATQSGVLAALLAERGYTGPEHVVDGKEGLVHCFGPDWKLEILTDGLGDTWELSLNTYKPFACGIVIHPVIDACLELRAEHALTAGSIAQVE